MEQISVNSRLKMTLLQKVIQAYVQLLELTIITSLIGKGVVPTDDVKLV